MTSILKLSDKTVLVVGASAGILEGFFELADQAGMKVHCAARNVEKLRALSHGCIQSAAGLDSFEPENIDAHPRFDGIVFAIGRLDRRPFRFATPATLHEDFEVNFFLQIELLKRLVVRNKLSEGASVVFLSSLASQVPSVGLLGYSSSKAALDAAVQVLALELGKKRIRVNSVNPGVVQTGLVDTAVNATNRLSHDEMQAHVEAYPLGPISSADVAGTILFLLSGLSQKMTGQNLVLDAGYRR